MNKEQTIAYFNDQIVRMEGSIATMSGDGELKLRLQRSLNAYKMAIKALEQQPTDAKETIIKSTLKYLIKMQIEEGSVGFAVDNDPDHDCCWDDVLAWLEAQPCEDMGEVSDGYHTFNQLYHQRAVLFATIVNQNKDKAWKSFKHSDGHYCFDSDGEWFIVGVDTPQGSYTYHYSKEYWDMFDCQELECGKEWDGHTEEDVTRLLSLEQQPCEDCISREEVQDLISRWLSDYLLDETREALETINYKVGDMPSVKPERPKGKWINDNCSICGYGVRPWNNTPYCPNCGAKMGGADETN